MRTAKTLIRLGECPGWSESLLGAHSFCWFCHVAAHLLGLTNKIGIISAQCDYQIICQPLKLISKNIFKVRFPETMSLLNRHGPLTFSWWWHRLKSTMLHQPCKRIQMWVIHACAELQIDIVVPHHCPCVPFSLLLLQSLSVTNTPVSCMIRFVTLWDLSHWSCIAHLSAEDMLKISGYWGKEV